MSDHPQKPLWGADNNALIALLAVNLVIAAGLGFMKVTYYLEGFPIVDFQREVYQYVVLHPNNLSNTAWTLFSFNWTHDSFWNLFTNLFWLLIFGSILQNNGHNKHLFPLYFYSGLVAGISYVVLQGPIPMLGAQTSVMAIAIAAVLSVPQYKLFPNVANGIPTWLIFLIYLVVTMASLFQVPFLLASAVVIGGLSGGLYVYLLKRGIDIGNWMHLLLNKINKSLSPHG